MAATLFEKARQAAQLLGEVADELEPGALDVEGAKTLVDVYTRCERFAIAGRGLAARRVAGAVNWKRSGHRNPAEWLATTTGVSVGDASRELETARRLEELPATKQAFRTVRDHCRETSMRASDDAARARRLHETRSARTYPGLDGHVAIHAELAPLVGAQVRSVIEQKTDELFRARRASGTTELRSAYMADAVSMLILGESPAPAPHVRLHLDGAAAERGCAEPGERCHIDGVGPVPVALAMAMLHDAKVTVLHHDDTGDITHVSSPARVIPARTRRWVEEAYPSCGRVGCDSTFRLEIDHIVAIADGGLTEKPNLWRLCGHDHHLKTHCGWRVVRDADGRPDLVPPGHTGPDPPRQE